ncbi:MAG: GNAT family protein [Alphaproteobacteria bacterium]
MFLRAPQLSNWSEWARLRAASRDFLTPWEPTRLEDELTKTAYRRRLRRYARDARDGVGYAFFIFRQEDDCLMGGITLSNVRRGVTQSCSMGYWMGQQYAGQGLMQDGVTTSLPFVFDELGLHRLEAACLPGNEASITVLLRTGFQKEGFARKYLRINGKWSDHVLFAMLQSDRGDDT